MLERQVEQARRRIMVQSPDSSGPPHRISLRQRLLLLPDHRDPRQQQVQKFLPTQPVQSLANHRAGSFAERRVML